MIEKLGKTQFGVCTNGDIVEKVNITNGKGMFASIISYGASVCKLLVQDRSGDLGDVVLGFNDLESYEGSQLCMGAIIGRIAGRLPNGSFSLDGVTYQLNLNEPKNHLHGGENGFHKRVWKVEFFTSNEVTLSLHCPDGLEGYPGNLDVRVTYSLLADHTLQINYSATTDKATPLSLTNHCWFNLSGEGTGTILDHELEVYADYYTATDKNMTLIGEVSPVDHVNDLRKKKVLKEVIPKLLQAHGDNYIFRDSKKSECRKVAAVYHQPSGRLMEVYSTERCLQFYGGKVLDSTLLGKSGQPYVSFGALCLECQGYPDGVNHPEIENIILCPDKTYFQQTKYKFLKI